MPSIWKDVRGFEGLYQVSTTGKVRSLTRYIERKDRRYLHRGKELKPYQPRNGPMVVGFRKNPKQSTHIVRKLVLETFKTYDRNKITIHINGDTYDCSVDNLIQVEKTPNEYDFPHKCKRNCDTIARTLEELHEFFDSVNHAGAIYYRSNCKVCRRNEEKLRQRDRTKDKLLHKANNFPEKYRMCYDCGHVQVKTKDHCDECSGENLTRYELI